MSIEVVGNEHHLLSMSVVLRNDAAQFMGEVNSGTSLSDSHRSFACKGLNGEKQIGGAVAGILIVFFGKNARLP